MNEFSPKYTPTVEETHSEEFVVNGQKILVDMIDTSGAYRWTDVNFGTRLSMRHTGGQIQSSIHDMFEAYRWTNVNDAMLVLKLRD